jgi:hypothetical protein
MHAGSHGLLPMDRGGIQGLEEFIHVQPAAELVVRIRSKIEHFCTKLITMEHVEHKAPNALPPQEAKTKLPTILSFSEIILISLNKRHANPICANHEPKGSSNGGNDMNNSVNHGSANIYQFPARVSGSFEGRRHEGKIPSAVRSPRVYEAAVGAGWYHEEAIRESDRVQKQ